MASRQAWRAAFEALMAPLDAFDPDLVMISAGFDAHARDPLASQALEAEDFAWATRAIMEVARSRAGGKVVSLLEGGYDLEALGRSAAAHVRAMQEGVTDRLARCGRAPPHRMPTDAAQPGQTIETGEPAAPPRAGSPAAPPRAGSIVLARHAEPALSRRVRLTARQYRDWWARYEAGGILPGQSPPPYLAQAARKAGVIYTSTRLRSIETARTLAEGRELLHDALFIEAPLPPPPAPDWIKLSPRKWGVVSRLWWWFVGQHGGEETRKQARRARRRRRRSSTAWPPKARTCWWSPTASSTP